MAKYGFFALYSQHLRRFISEVSAPVRAPTHRHDFIGRQSEVGSISLKNVRPQYEH